MVKFDSNEPGTPATVWQNSPQLGGLPDLDLASVEGLTVVAAHPDDETLGAGGLVADMAARGVTVTVVVVTDGAASHPGSMKRRLAGVRREELRGAVEELANGATLIELGFPDGRTDVDLDAIATRLTAVIPEGGTIAAPWRGDGHRDHRIIGELCARIAAQKSAQLLEYPIWMGHWSNAEDTAVPWATARAHHLSPTTSEAKAHALDWYASQTSPRGELPPVLRPDFMEHFRASREVFFWSPSDRRQDATKDQRYFDDLYARNADPWRLATRWYEERKRAITVASLPLRRYRAGLEIGCSVGELSHLLGTRVDQLLAIDISASAVRAASARTADMPSVAVEQRDATVDFPDLKFDLIVLSEVGYYWDRPTLTEMVATIHEHLSVDGMILACHWRHQVDDYPLGGDEVHEELRSSTQLSRIVSHVEDDFVLEIFAKDPRSVADREGLLT